MNELVRSETSNEISNGPKYEYLVEEGKKAVVGISNKLWELGDLANKVEKFYGENTLGQFANDINFPGSAKTLKRYRDVCRAFPENAGRPAFLTAAQALASHPDRHEIFKQKPNLTEREARQLMHTYSQISSAENQKASQPAFSRADREQNPELVTEPMVNSAADMTSEPSWQSVPEPPIDPSVMSVPESASEPSRQSVPEPASEPTESSIPESESEPFTARVPEITSEPPAASVPVERSELSGASVPVSMSEPRPTSAPTTESDPSVQSAPSVKSDPLHGRAPLVSSEPEPQRAPVAPSEPCPSSVPANVSEPSIESPPKNQSEQEILYPESQVIALRAERNRFEVAAESLQAQRNELEKQLAEANETIRRQGSELVLFRETEVKLVEANETLAGLKEDIELLNKQLIESERDVIRIKDDMKYLLRNRTI